MRAFIMAGLSTAGFAMVITPALAQQYPPNVPVCMQVYDLGGSFTECRYGSIPQCQASASGRSAQCIENPYFIGSASRAFPRSGRRVYSERY